MMKTATRIPVAASLTCAVALTFGCGGEAEVRQEHSVGLDGAALVSVNLTMDGGELDVSGGSAALMEADLVFPESTQPAVNYSTEGTQGFLELTQGERDTSFSSFPDNRWDLAFNDAVPLSMSISMDDGDANLALGSLTLESLDFVTDVGDVTLDLAGDPRVDLQAYVEVDLGQVDLRLPAEVTARVTVNIGDGGVDAPGFVRESTGAYVRRGDADAPTYDIVVNVDQGGVDLEIVD